MFTDTNRPYVEEHIHAGLTVTRVKKYPNAETYDYSAHNQCSSIQEQLRNASVNTKDTIHYGTINNNASAIPKHTNPCEMIINHASQIIE